MTTFQEAFDDASAEVGSEDLALEDGPAIGGETGNEGTVSTEEVVAPKTYFDIDQYGDQLVKIKVDGEEREVPLRELPNGFMRNEAFTQKSQALAAERSRLQAAETLAAAYERNPYETVRFLAQEQGITLAEAKAQAEAVAEQDGTWENDTVVDPRLSAIEAQMAEIQNERARRELERTLAGLGARYGDDFDANEVVARAIEFGTTDLEAVYKMVAFDRITARSQAQAQVQEQRSAVETRTTQLKQDLAATVSSGGSFAGAGSSGSTPITSVSQALDAALAGSGFEF